MGSLAVFEAPPRARLPGDPPWPARLRPCLCAGRCGREDGGVSGVSSSCGKNVNAEFQRIARRDKKAFSDQCKEIEENNRMGKTRDLFKKIRDTKGTFHAKMDTIKDRNGMDLTETEDIKKRWQ